MLSCFLSQGSCAFSFFYLDYSAPNLCKAMPFSSSFSITERSSIIILVKICPPAVTPHVYSQTSLHFITYFLFFSTLLSTRIIYLYINTRIVFIFFYTHSSLQLECEPFQVMSYDYSSLFFPRA